MSGCKLIQPYWKPDVMTYFMNQSLFTCLINPKSNGNYEFTNQKWKRKNFLLQLDLNVAPLTKSSVLPISYTDPPHYYLFCYFHYSLAISMATSANFHGDPKGNLSKNFFFSRICLAWLTMPGQIIACFRCAHFLV